MKRIFPSLFILFICIVYFYQFFLKGLLPIPADTIVGLYHPFRDVYAEQYPRGIPYKNFLITDPVRQQYPWRELAIRGFKEGKVPYWNPYSFAGYPLLANFQTAAWYPLNIIFFIMPFYLGWTFLIFLQPLLGGIILYLYLKHQKISKLSTLIGVVSWILSGFFTAWLEWGTIAHTILWLPLSLLAIDKVIESPKKIQWYALLLGSIVFSFFAGHLQSFFYSSLFIFAYTIFSLWRNTVKRIIILRLGIVALLGLFISSIQWIPSLGLILQSARDIDQVTKWQEAGWFIPWQHLVQFIVPDFFGNPTTLNYWGTWNYGELIGYIGIIPLFFAVYSFFFRRSRMTLFLISIIALSLLFSLPTGISALPFIAHIPFLSSSQPTRLLGIIDLSLCILAALGADQLFKKPRKVLVTLLPFIVVLIALWIASIIGSKQADLEGEVNWLVTQKNLIIPSVVLLSSSLLLVLYSRIKNLKLRIIIILIILAIITGDLLRFGLKFNSFTPKEYLYPTSKIITYLQSQKPGYRIMTTDDRILAPNFTAHYELESIDGYDPLYLKQYAEFSSALVRGRPDIASPWGFNRIIAPHDSTSPLINLLGVKYILSLTPIAQMREIAQEGETRLYENAKALPRAFFVRKVSSTTSKEEMMQRLYSYSTNWQENAVTLSSDSFSQKEFAVGNVTISSYTRTSRTFQTNLTKEGFLVITENYYPGLTVTIDGKKQLVYKTNYLFMGVIVPAGDHLVRVEF